MNLIVGQADRDSVSDLAEKNLNVDTAEAVELVTRAREKVRAYFSQCVFEGVLQKSNPPKINLSFSITNTRNQLSAWCGK